MTQETASTKPTGERGFTAIELLFVVLVLSIIAAVSVPNLMETKAAAREGVAVATVRQIANAEVAFSATHGEFGTLDDLIDAGLVDNSLGEGSMQSYSYEAATDGEGNFSVTAVPSLTGPGQPRRGFFCDASGVLRVSDDGSKPDANSPVLNFADRGWAIIESDPGN